MSTAPAPLPSSVFSPGALPGARTLGLAIALLLAACQTDTPHRPHATQHGARSPVQAATPVLNAADALAGHSRAAPATPDPHTQTAATLDLAPTGNNLDDILATPIAPRTAPHKVRLSQPPLDNPDAADLLDDWGHRSFGRILAHRPLADPPADGDAERLSVILDAARTPGGSPPVPNLHDDDKIVVFGSRRGITLGRWIAGAADTLSMSFDLSHAGPAIEQREGFLPLLKRAGKVWTNRIHDTWEPWDLEPGHVKLHLSTQDGPETPIVVGPDGEISTGIEVHVASLDLSGSIAGLGGPVNRWPTDRWEPHFGTLTIDTHHLDRAEDHQLLSTLVHELGHVLGSWLGVAYTQPYAPYADEQTGHWTGPNVVALHGGPAPFQDHDNPFDSHDGQRDPNATHYDFAHSGVCASVMAYCRHGASAPDILPTPIDFAFLADLGLSVGPATDTPETYGLAGWMHHSGFAFSVSRDLRMDVAYPAHNGGRGFHATPSLDVSDLLHAEATAFGRRSTGDLLAAYPPAEHFGNARYAGTLIGAAIDRPALPPSPATPPSPSPSTASRATPTSRP